MSFLYKSVGVVFEFFEYFEVYGIGIRVRFFFLMFIFYV